MSACYNQYVINVTNYLYIFCACRPRAYKPRGKLPCAELQFQISLYTGTNVKSAKKITNRIEKNLQLHNE